MLPNNRFKELGSSNQGASSLAVKSTGVVSAPCYPWKCALTAISGVANVLEGSEGYTTNEFSERVAKFTSRISVAFILTQPS